MSTMQENTGETISTSGVVFPSGLESGERRTSIRTLESDVAEAVRRENLSFAKIAIKEQERRLSRAALPGAGDIAKEPGRARRALAVIVSILFIILGAGALWYAYAVFIAPGSADEPPQIAGPSAFIAASEERALDITGLGRAAVLALIEKEQSNAALQSDSIISLSFARQQTATSSEKVAVASAEFLEILQTRAPGRLSRSLEDGFFAGLYAPADGGTQPFLIFKTSSFETAFAGMLEWEDNLPSDLPFILVTGNQPLAASPQPPAPSTQSTTSPASTTTSNQQPVSSIQLPPVWRDVIVKNKDARALVAGDNSVSLIYAFSDKQTLVIAPSKELLAVLFEKLSTARFTQ